MELYEGESSEVGREIFRKVLNDAVESFLSRRFVRALSFVSISLCLRPTLNCRE